jgi:hypothetical protein
MPTFSILRTSTLYPNWDFRQENKPSGNPVLHNLSDFAPEKPIRFAHAQSTAKPQFHYG